MDKEETQIKGLKTKKLITMHSRNDLYVPRKEGERVLVGIEECVDTSIQSLEDYIKSSEERLH